MRKQLAPSAWPSTLPAQMQSVTSCVEINQAPEAPSGGGASLGANVRLEDLVTEHELSDSSEIVARRVAGYLDLGAMIALPLCYMIVVIVYFNRFGAMMAEEEFENTKVVHVAPEDF